MLKVYQKKVSLLWLLTLVFGMIPSNAGIYFGSKDSAIKIKHLAAMEIKTKNEMEITGGSLVNEGEGIITGQNVLFNRGAYGFFNSLSDLQAILNPNNNIVALAPSPTDPNVDGGTMISNAGGLRFVSLNVFQGSNILRGQPLFFGPNDIVLQNNHTLLAIAVQNTVNTNIILNGGAIFLQDDLRLGDDAVILDSGTVVFNNRRLSLGGKINDWNGTILWNSALDLTLNSAINLNGEWIFFGAEGQINGNGNVIDLANGGSIVVLENSVLRLAAVHIKGLGIADGANTGGNIKLLPGATLVLSDATIEMASDFNIDAGTVFVEGNSTIITKENILSFVDGPNGSKGKLIVDRVALTYDTLSTIDQYNIKPQLILDPMREHVEIFNQGEIRSIRQDTTTYHNYRSSPTLFKYLIIAPYRPFFVFPEVDNGQFVYDVLLDGNTNFMGFTRTDEKIFTVTENVHATLQNMTLRDISTKHIQFDPGSSLVFGDGTNISFARNETLDYPWIFEGNVNLYGGGKTLEFRPGGAFEVQGKHSVLLLDGLIIKGLSGNQIRCLKNSSKIQLRNVKFILEDNVTYDIGGLEILDDVSIVGGFNLVAGNPNFFSFNYLSNRPFTIKSNATLSLTRNAIFTYAPTEGSPSLFQFEDSSSALLLDQATLAAPTGLILSTGQLLVRGRNFISGNVIFDPSLFIDQPAGATLEQI